MKRFTVAASMAALVTSACGGQAGIAPATTALREQPGLSRHSVGAGKIITARGGGEIYGFDVDQSGTDGVLATATEPKTGIWKVSVQTFDTNKAKITKSFANFTGPHITYQMDGIFDNDVALITRFVETKKKPDYAWRHYVVMNPATQPKFNGKWQPPGNSNFSVLEHAVNQTTSPSVVYGLELKHDDAPALIASDIATNSDSKLIKLNQQYFDPGDVPELAQDTVHDRAIMATSPDGGAAGGPPPIIATVDLKSGKYSQFSGVQCPGIEGCGDADGLAYDSATGIACTTTTYDAGVEFYDVAKKTGFRVSMPGNPSELSGGSTVANDPINKLFLVAQPFTSTGGNGSSIQVFDEKGDFVESIDGLNFTFVVYSVEPIIIALQPSARSGWVTGPSFSQIQEFTY
jgi:hypothetical protein